MIKKVKEFLSNCTREGILDFLIEKISVAVFILTILFVSAKITIEQRWVELFTYQNEEYQLLEDEAARMVENHTFDTEYNCIIKNWDTKSDDISFRLKDKNVYIDVIVTDYKKETQKFETEREAGSRGEYIFVNIFLIFMVIPFIWAFLVTVALVILWLIIVGIIILFSKIKK